MLISDVRSGQWLGRLVGGRSFGGCSTLVCVKVLSSLQQLGSPAADGKPVKNVKTNLAKSIYTDQLHIESNINFFWCASAMHIPSVNRDYIILRDVVELVEDRRSKFVDKMIAFGGFKDLFLVNCLYVSLCLPYVCTRVSVCMAVVCLC